MEGLGVSSSSNNEPDDNEHNIWDEDVKYIRQAAKPCRVSFVKLVLHKNHQNRKNQYNQVWVMQFISIWLITRG